MVGIHERSGREKIFSSNVAHALNDETSRKYIQSLKRLVSIHFPLSPSCDNGRGRRRRERRAWENSLLISFAFAFCYS